MVSSGMCNSDALSRRRLLKLVAYSVPSLVTMNVASVVRAGSHSPAPCTGGWRVVPGEAGSPHPKYRMYRCDEPRRRVWQWFPDACLRYKPYKARKHGRPDYAGTVEFRPCGGAGAFVPEKEVCYRWTACGDCWRPVACHRHEEGGG